MPRLITCLSTRLEINWLWRMHCRVRWILSDMLLCIDIEDGIEEIYGSVEKIRENFNYIKVSHVRNKKFLQCVNQVPLDNCKRLNQDAPSLWNCTFFMHQGAIYYPMPFCVWETQTTSVVYLRNSRIKLRKSKVCRDIDNVTFISFESKYPIANLYYPQVFVVCRHG